MKHISFAWTTDALLAGVKTVTRREWDDRYARSFRRGDLVAAYDKSPRAHGKQVATIELTSNSYQEHVGEAGQSEYYAEGLGWMEEQGKLVQGLAPLEFWQEWQDENPLVWVIRFKLVAVAAAKSLGQQGRMDAL